MFTTTENTLWCVNDLEKEIKALGGKLADFKRCINFVNQSIIVFPNGYGASVIKGYGSYGLELAVIKLDTNAKDKWDISGEWDLCYDTPVTDDVIGFLDKDSLLENLKKISQLPKAEN